VGGVRYQESVLKQVKGNAGGRVKTKTGYLKGGTCGYEYVKAKVPSDPKLGREELQALNA